MSCYSYFYEYTLIFNWLYIFDAMHAYSLFTISTTLERLVYFTAKNYGYIIVNLAI